MTLATSAQAFEVYTDYTPSKSAPCWSAAISDPDPELYKKFQTEMRARLEQAKQDKIVEGCDEMRTFWGEMNFRRIDFK